MSNKDVGTGYIDNIILYIQKNRMQTFYNLILLLIILIQLPFMVQGLDSVTVEVDLPPKGKVIVKNDSANELYYNLWTEHFTNNYKYSTRDEKGEKIPFPFTTSIVDFDYTNVEMKYTDFLKYYKPSRLIKEKQVYIKFIKNIKVKMITQKFEVENINIKLFDNGHEAEATIKGVAFQKYATLPQEPKECKYTITYERIGGKNYVTSLNTDCF